MAYETELAQAQTAQGNDNPTLSFNLANAGDFSPGLQFIDLMHQMRPWRGHEPGDWGSMTTDDIIEGGYLDADGWPTEIPPGMESIGGLWGWQEIEDRAADYNQGVYIVEWDGQGTIEMGGNINIISQEDGKIVFENLTGGHFNLNITETDPSNNGDYIRNISVVAEKNYELYEAGAVFNPDWLEIVKDSRELRFMDWMITNDSEIVTWDDRPHADGPNLGNGVPLEYMVQLANELGVDPWFTMPHQADDDYIRNFAEYVKEHLDPALTAKVEYSNETWNWNFEQTHWLLEQSETHWGESSRVDYHVKKAVETALIWNEVFEGEPEGRLSNVLGSQAANAGLSNRMLNANAWLENEPDNWVDPKTVFDELAITTYFGGGSMRTNGFGEEILAAIKDPSVDEFAFMAEKLMDPEVSQSIPTYVAYWEDQEAIAEEAGLDLTLYEGGQHVHHLFPQGDMSDEDYQLAQDFFEGFIRSEEMAELYSEIWDAWSQIGDGAFMQFWEIQTPSKYGSWGLYDSLDDETPRGDVLNDLNETETPWWDATGGEHYQHGVTETGTDADDTLIGTSQEDYLMAGDGDDVIVAGAGDDGIHGGDGTDRVVLSGSASDYIVQIEGDGYRVSGPDGSDFIIDVEELAFSSNQLLVLADLAVNSDGTLQLPGSPGPIDPDDPEEPEEPIDPEDPEEPVDPEDPEEPVDPVDPVETDDTDDQADAGEIMDAADMDRVTMSDLGGDGGGVNIIAVDAGSTLGSQLSLDGSETASTFMTFAAGSGNPSSGMSGSTAGPVELDLSNAAIVKNAVKILATSGDDYFVGADTHDQVSGAAGDDALYGLLGDDVLRGNKGHDYINGGAGDDNMRGHQGRDEMYGGTGDDMMNGGYGHDVLVGGGGDDSLVGRAGADTLDGGAGHDRMNAGHGHDTMTGGSGRDQFVFDLGTGHDIVTDFATNDTLVLQDFFANGQAVEDSVGMDDGNLVITNGEDRITLLGLDMDDLDWVLDSVG